MSSEYWRGKKVLVTGHTGFKGAWLSLVLHELGARVFGVSLKPQPETNLYTLTSHGIFESESFRDLRNKSSTIEFVEEVNPQIVFHLAAQASVLEGYRDPEATWTSNVLCTLNIIESLSNLDSPVALLVTTTDKVYLNKNQDKEFVEEDRLGGSDPYSSSKVAVEELIISYRKVFKARNQDVKIAVARAGNVIGGGDFMADRIIPDAFRAIQSRDILLLRNPEATRPWQHVLDPLFGYISLAEKLHSSNSPDFQDAFNFSNPENSGVSVRRLLEFFPSDLGLKIENQSQNTIYPEAKFLNLNSEKSRIKLMWHPVMSVSEAMRKTIEWYLNYMNGTDMRDFTIAQIKEYIDREPH